MKILFFDLDGTLYLNGAISPRCREALLRVRNAGASLVLNTGRAPGFVPREVYELPLWEGRICGSAYIEWKGEVLSNAVLGAEQIGRVCAVCEKLGVPVVFEGVKESYSLFERWPDIRPELEKGRVPPVTKITFWCDPLLIEARDFPGFRIVRFKNYAEGITEGYDKSTGMEMIMRKEGLCKDDLWAFGDSENDLDMLRFAGNAVCMASAPDYFDGFCLYRCVQPDGVPEALDRFFPG